MNTSELKAYAPKARRDFIAAITKQAQKYGVTKDLTHPVQINGDVCVVNGKAFPASLAQRIKRLGERVNSQGFAPTMEQIAYSWFNRLIAIRYMELNDYLGHGRRVLSHPDHPTGFQILEECTELSYGNSGEAGELPGLTHEKVVELKLDGTKDEELYRELLLAQCHALHQAMPFLFETIDDETELLLPENLTKTDSLIHDLITDLAESNWRDSESGKGNIEVVGWLYQFYISEKKDEVIGKVVKSEDIPAATQLFTPNWIVKYMVQNSLGAQWLATYPESPLKAQMEYYIEPAEQTDEVNAQLKAITPESLNPEELTLIDPAMGSGHILVEAYDLFKAIYLERGYRQRDIAQLILEKNLFGLDIDQRAAQLTGFALMMKGREDDRRLFERGVKLNVMAMVDSTSLDVDTLVHGIDLSKHDLTAEDLTALKDLFEHATTFGSLIQVPQLLAEKLPALKQLSESNSQDMFVSEVLGHLVPLLQQAKMLVREYDAVVANPPYMGNNYQTPKLKKYLKEKYKGYEKDFFSAFIYRCLGYCKENGGVGVVAPYVWMFISSYEKLRETIICETTLKSLIQLEYNAFEPACIPVAAFTLDRKYKSDFIGSYIKLSEFKGHQNQAPRTLEAINNHRCGWMYKTKPDNLRNIPGSLIAYWASNEVISSFSIASLGKVFTTREGMATADNDRFLRMWSEVSNTKIELQCESEEDAELSGGKWFPYNKGGEYRRWYGNNNFVVEYQHRGFNIKNNRDPKTDRLRSHNYNGEYGFKEGLTWSALTSGLFSIRFSPKGYLFDSKGAKGFTEYPYQVLALLNSNVAQRYLSFLSPTLDFKVGDVIQIPLIEKLLSDNTNQDFRENVQLAKLDWDSYERSWDFQLFPLLSNASELTPTLESSYITWITQNQNTVADMKRLEEENNRLFIDVYGLQDELSPEVPIEQITLTVNPAYRYGVKGTEEERDTRFREDTMAELVSYAIGCMMGRYSLDEPGLIYANSGNEGFDDLVERGAYTKFPADDDGIIPLTDKEWFADDAANRLVEFISVAWPAGSGTESHLEENLDFLAANLSPKKGEDSRDTIRRYLCDKFYKDHLQTYKKRPIYWLFSSGKQKAFQCLVYLHRYNESTLARMRTEYVIPLTAKLSAHIDNLESDKLASDSAAEIKKLEKDIKTLQKQQTELTEFDDKLKHFADMRIRLDLDDGVKVNYGKFGDLLAEVKDIHGKKV